MNKLYIIVGLLISSISLNAELVPKKVGELDLKEMTGKDAEDFLDVNVRVSGNIQDLFFINVSYFNFTENNEDSYFILRGEDGNFLVLENVKFNRIEEYISFFVIKFNGEELIYGKRISLRSLFGESSTYYEYYRMSIDNKLSIIDKDKYVFEGHSNDGRSFRKGNLIEIYDLQNWVESEGGNSEPQIMFSKITPNGVTIKGETSKGGTIERSTDLKNWKRLVRVSKGGFEVFVDPTEKDKEFFRIKSE